MWNIALYGNETWTLQKSDIKRIEAFDMWIWRRMLKVSWTEHKNDEVLITVETRSELMDTLKTRQKSWLGHCVATCFFGENSVQRSTAREERKKKTKIYATELATGDR